MASTYKFQPQESHNSPPKHSKTIPSYHKKKRPSARLWRRGLLQRTSPTRPAPWPIRWHRVTTLSRWDIPWAVQDQGWWAVGLMLSMQRDLYTWTAHVHQICAPTTSPVAERWVAAATKSTYPPNSERLGWPACCMKVALAKWLAFSF